MKAIALSPFVMDAKRNQRAWERRYRERVGSQMLETSSPVP